MDTFPKNMEVESKSVISSIFGNRFLSDQTLYEYLIEFLLIFASAKDADLETGKMKLHNVKDGEQLSYWAEPRMGLRRFIFFDKSRKNGTLKEDEIAYNQLFNALVNKMDVNSKEDAVEIIESIQDLFHGYAVVIKNRFWGAQALMPICPEFLFCGANPNEKERKKRMENSTNTNDVDKFFAFDKRNFLARGGELYYLHILQGLGEDLNKKEQLEKLLKNVLCEQCPQISNIASFIQKTWEEENNMDKTQLVQKYSLAYIPSTGYDICGKYTVDELINFLSCKLHPIRKIELLSTGVMFQIFRMMCMRVADYLNETSYPWIIDMQGNSLDTIKKISSNSFKTLENAFVNAFTQKCREMGLSDEELMKKSKKAKNNSLDILRSKGKEIKFIIPISGAFERFTLPEEITRFLVLSLIKPGDKMTLDLFLKKLYINYNIVIGPNEYKESLHNGNSVDSNLANSFVENKMAFQEFLNATGFLKELSDATSIVVNPYDSIL